ncbi:hypothetical protein L1987_21136 [Smallanthus sonchifolius]|uniref:Uncharacterized protein n=1 Tax=Smallanthus sonchifolius TaxID=185202 RepID=A0ACB9IU17_9ASTR|nr:hypothetical protein L1987_21136 [Smallanthus sonchifolius]
MNANGIPRSSRPRTIPCVMFNRAQIERKEFAFKEIVSHFVLHDDKNNNTYEILKDVVMGESGEGDGEEREYEHPGRNEPRRAYEGRPVMYGRWPPKTRETWEIDTREIEETKRWRQEQRELLLCHIYQQEKYYDNYFNYCEHVRHQEDYRDGLLYQEYTPVEYMTLLRYDPNDATSNLPIYPHNIFDTSSMAREN